jgi:hypothetical protein
MTPRHLSLAAGALIAAALAGIWLGDLMDADRAVVLAEVEADDPIPVVAGAAEPASEEPFVYPEVHVPVVVAAELAPEVGAPAEPEPGTPGPGGGSPPPDPGFDPPATDDDGRDLIADSLGGIRFELLDPFGPILHFIDFCADHGGDPSCPPGVGGTVLGAFGGGGDPGPFALGDLYPASLGWPRCDRPASLRSNQTLLMVLSTHPAVVTYTYYPADDPADMSTVVVDTSDASHPEHTRWIATIAATGGPASGSDRVHNCFVLEGEAASQRYVIEAVATSFSGETASATYSFTTAERRDRPPVVVAPLSDYEANVVIPMRGDDLHTTVVRVIDSEEEGLRCDEIERASIFLHSSDPGARPLVAPLPDAGYLLYSGWEGSVEIGDDIVGAPDWPYDPAYDTYTVWNLNLREGRRYLLCIWWVRSPTRSFDAATIAEREAQWLFTPDRVSTRIRLLGIRAAAGGLAADSLELGGSCITARIPDVALGADEAVTWSPADAPVLCDYQGYQQPDTTTIRVFRGDDPERTFAIPTPNLPSAVASTLVTLDLSTRRGSGLCGSGFGSCDPPTTTYPGPQITLLVEHLSGAVNHRDDWDRGGPFVPLTPPAVPTTLPESAQIDWFASGVEADGQHALRMTASFDRPVSLTARLRGAPDDSCLSGEMLEGVVSELRTSHILSFTGLCTQTGYAIDLTVTDGDGTVTEFVTEPRIGALRWDGFGFTAGWPVRYFVGLRSSFGTDMYVRTLSIRVAGGRIDLVPESRCLTALQSMEIREEWGDEIPVTVIIGIVDASDSSGSCEPLRGYSSLDASVEATFTIDQFRSGEIVIPITLVEADGGTLPGFISIVIRGTG